ncbi:hypothetical protein VIGAN_06020400, partial [Vigna angularis var. angularis]
STTFVALSESPLPPHLQTTSFIFTNTYSTKASPPSEPCSRLCSLPLHLQNTKLVRHDCQLKQSLTIVSWSPRTKCMTTAGIG